MLFKADAATLERMKAGDAITALMSRRGSDRVWEEVKVAAPKKN